jgi:hypothetical protein
MEFATGELFLSFTNLFLGWQLCLNLNILLCISPILLLLRVASSLILSFRYSLLLFLKWLLALCLILQTKKQTPWSESASELYRPTDRSDCQLVWIEGATWSAWRIPPAVFLGFIDRSRYFSIKLLLSLYSRGWVHPVPDPLHFFSGSAGNRTRASGSIARTLTTRPQRRSSWITAYFNFSPK